MTCSIGKPPRGGRGSPGDPHRWARNTNPKDPNAHDGRVNFGNPQRYAVSLSLSCSLYIYIYIYLYRQRERPPPSTSWNLDLVARQSQPKILRASWPARCAKFDILRCPTPTGTREGGGNSIQHEDEPRPRPSRPYLHALQETA